ncbi:MAG: hypothetical protein MK198_11100 [Gracilimonas sp.]|uniref:hypothetical protein n=1 Tax=Gracilimonas sp. TaxID=1974203 RepID=UPI003753D370|nr:hypothetical protein [Gracilimonas sp.]
MANSGIHNPTEEVRKHLRSAFGSLLSKRKGTLLLRAFLILFAGLTALIIAEHVIYLSFPTKLTLILSVLIAAGVSFWKGYTNFGTESFTDFYREFSRKSNLPELKDTLDLEKSGVGNPALIDAAIFQNLSKINSERLSDSLDDHIRSSHSYAAYRQLMNVNIAVLVVFLITSFNFSDAARRTFSFWETFKKPNPYSFTISPGTVTLEQGSPFQVDINFDGDLIPDEVELKIKTSVEEEYRTRAMEGSGATFTSITQDLNNDLQYYVEMDGYQSQTYNADVQLRPRFSELKVTVIPPDYTGLHSTINTYPISQVRAYEGSKLNLSGTLNKEITSLQLYTNKGFSDMSVEEDSTFIHDLEVSEDDTLRFYIEDENGLTNRNPFQIVISPQGDEYPLAEIIEPEDNIREVNPSDVDILYRAIDDFGLTGASLNYELRKAYVEDPITGSITFEQPTQGDLNSYVWDLNEFELSPQDILTFWITVQDNDGYNGYKSSDSRIITLEVPSLVEYFDDIDKKEDEVETDLSDISEAFEQTREQYERFKEQMKDNPGSAGYEEKRALEQVQKQQEEVQRRIDELNKKFEELKNELSEDNMLSEETQQAYEELQKLMEEIDDPAYREALEKLREQFGEMTPEQMRQAMQNLEFNEELYKERLERTIELFKQIKLNSDLDKLARSFEDMARREGERDPQGADNTDQAKNEQLRKTLEENENLKEKIESLSENTSSKNEKEIADFQQKSKEELDVLSEEIKKEINSGDESEEGNDQQEQKNNNEQDSSGQGQSKPQNRQAKYQQLAEQTKELMSEMGQNQMRLNIAGLQYVLYSLLNVSLEQENLTTLASNTENRSQAYVTYARNQSNVEGFFDSISDSLFQLSSEIPQFSNEINKKKLEVQERLQRSLEQMSERNREQSSVASRQALGGINDISFMVANLLEELQNSEGGGSGGGGMSMQQMIEQLQQSGQNQQQLNKMLQEMINDMQGERLSQDQMERLNQIARQQNEIRKQLQELQQSGELDGDRLGSEIQRMIEDMEDTINDLRGGAADPTLVERQQNILSRMLEAEQAMQEQGEEEEREGSGPNDFNPATPPKLTLEELEKEIQNRLNDPNFTKYSPDYQRMIENYFELLKQLQEREIQ